MESHTTSWSQLPPEIRLEVTKKVVLGVQQDGGCLAPYAAINSEWQAFTERVTLRSLKFTPSRLENPAFVAMVNRARELDLLRHLGLFIPLAEYDCSRCGEFPTPEEWESDMVTIWDSLKAAFTLLSTWTPRGHLSLDITVQSPSDASHYFKLVHVDEHVPDTTLPVHDPYHGWQEGRMVTLPPEDAFFRVFEDIEFSAELWQELPQVTAVTTLYLRRQTTRRWAPQGVRELAERLVGLQELYHEPWR
jgi:hypothetical protein